MAQAACENRLAVPATGKKGSRSLRVGARFDIDSGPVHTLADISLWVTNFTNAYYFSALTGARATALVLGSPGQPRTFGITLRGTL